MNVITRLAGRLREAVRQEGRVTLTWKECAALLWHLSPEQEAAQRPEAHQARRAA